MRRAIRLTLTALVLGSLALPLASCADTDYKTHIGFDTFMSRERSTLRETNFAGEFETAKIDKAAIHGIAEHYNHFGDGPLSLTVTYDPKSRTNTASHAATEAARIGSTLHNFGVSEVKTDILPAAGKGDKSTTSISYAAVVAEAPKDCHAMAGLDGRQTYTDPDYPMGCTIEMQLAKEVARPQDLQGRTGLDTASGRRQYLVVEPYKEGKPNPPLANAQTVQ